MLLHAAPRCIKIVPGVPWTATPLYLAAHNRPSQITGARAVKHGITTPDRCQRMRVAATNRRQFDLSGHMLRAPVATGTRPAQARIEHLDRVEMPRLVCCPVQRSCSGPAEPHHRPVVGVRRDAQPTIRRHASQPPESSPVRPHCPPLCAPLIPARPSDPADTRHAHRPPAQP